MKILYLDSNDISDLATLKRDIDRENLGRLLALKNNGKVEIRFSGIHILEAAHLSTTSLPWAKRRAEVLLELCGGKCLTWIFDLTNREVLQAASGGSLERPGYAFNEEGRWFPNVESIAHDLRDVLAETFREELKKLGLPRGHRRKLEKTYMRDGVLTPAAMPILEASGDTFVDTMAQSLPISRNLFSRDVLLRFACGEDNASAVVRQLENTFAHLPTFFEWACESFDSETTLRGWLRSEGAGFIDFIGNVRRMVDELAELGRKLGREEKEANREVTILVRRAVLEARTRILEVKIMDLERQHPEIPQEDWDRVRQSKLGQLPINDAVLGAMESFGSRETKLARGSRRTLESSDWADVLHMAYIPLVDVFKCDVRSIHIAKPIAARTNTAVVSHLRDAFEALEA